MSEEVILAMETNEPKVLYFTSDRVIVAKIGGGMGLVMAFGLVGAIVEARRQAKKKEQLSKISPESILTADKKNFAIPYAEISKVELFKKMFGRRIRIIAGKRKHEFWLGKPKEFENYAIALQPVLGDKLVVSR